MPLQRKRSWMNWDGCEPIAAWQPLYAPSFQDSLWNWRSAFATIGVTPAWAPATGWTFDGASQYLTTAITPSGDQTWSMLIACTSGYAAAGFVSDGYKKFLTFTRSDSGGQVIASSGAGDWGYVGSLPSSPYVVGFAGRDAYVNGVDVGDITDEADTTYSSAVQIGSINALGWYAAGTIPALAIYDSTLTLAQMWRRAQMLAHLANSDWSVWTPARRWFIPPPPPVAATPVLSSIYINSADIGDTSLFDDVSGAAVSSSYARTGANSFKLDGADYLQADLTSSATKYSKFGLLVTDTPASDALLVAWQETGTEHVSLYLTDKLTLQMQQGSTIIQTSPTTLEINTWYCIETKVIVHDTIGRFQVRIDGVDDMSAIGINTDDDVSGTINAIRFESPVDDTYIDDIVVREDKWCGTGGVYVVVPTAAGTVEKWTGAYTDVDDLPPSFTNYAEVTAESGSDQLFRHGGLGGDYDVSVVGVFAKGRLDSEAAEVPFYALVRSSLTDNVGYAQTLDTTGVYARQLLTTDPNGTVAWTAYAVDNALQIGVRG